MHQRPEVRRGNQYLGPGRERTGTCVAEFGRCMCRLGGPIHFFLIALSLTLPGRVRAGGSGLNTVVVINQASPNSRELGNYYCERRGVPPENVLRIHWTGGNVEWSSNDFHARLVAPLLDLLATRQLSNQVDYVVLSMDIPFRTLNAGQANSTTSALFYGLKDAAGPSWWEITNGYYASELPFRIAPPAGASGRCFLTTMLTGTSLARAKRVVDQGVDSDGTWPTQPVLLAKSSDTLRNIRYRLFDHALFNCALRATANVRRTNDASPWGKTNLLGYATGLAMFSVSSNAFVPGAMADSLSSFGGIIFGGDQTSLLAFLEAGAAGSYGTVTEPTTSLQKFPNLQNYFYQARGFNLAESYYQSLSVPYQGLIVAEPLAAPFARAARGQWRNVSSNAVLSGTVTLGVEFTGMAEDHFLYQIDLFVDGKYFRTLTNLAPQAGNQLTVTVNGYPVTYTVSGNASLDSVARGLATALNATTVSNQTRVGAQAFGDRIELRSLATNRMGTPFFLVAPSNPNVTNRQFALRYLTDPPAPRLAIKTRNPDGSLRLQLESAGGNPCWLQASADLITWTTIFTNTTGGPLDWVDLAAAQYPWRFYRLVGTPRETGPQLVGLGLRGNAGFGLRVLPRGAPAYEIQASGDLIHWFTLFQNAAGSEAEYFDAEAVNHSRRFYRVRVPSARSAAPATVAVLQNPLLDGVLLRVDGTAQPYMILESTNQIQWMPVWTNLAAGLAQLEAISRPGTGGVLTTHLLTGRNTFLDSPARGLRTFNLTGSNGPGAWLRLVVVKTNGGEFTLSVTNQSGANDLFTLAQQMVEAINASPTLQTADGIFADDLASTLFGGASFNLYARSPGLEAAGVQITLTGYGGVGTAPATPMRLDANLSDLQPRNHLYVATGTRRLAVTFPLDTTQLPDGFHELTAVAYEGTAVRTQTRISLPVEIRNTSLSASLTPSDFGDTTPVAGTYHFRVTASTNAIHSIRLFTTGGEWAAVTNQASATFTVEGVTLGAGLHPFYALVRAADGTQYRTATRWVRLLGP